MSNGNNIYVGKLKGTESNKESSEVDQGLFSLGLQNVMDLTGIRIWGKKSDSWENERAPYRVYVGDTQVYPEDIHKKIPFMITYILNDSFYAYNFTEDSDILNRWNTGFWLDVNDIGTSVLVSTTTTKITIESAYPWFVDQIIGIPDFASIDRGRYRIPSWDGINTAGIGYISSVGKRKFPSDVDTYIITRSTMRRNYAGSYDIGQIDNISSSIEYYGVSRKLEQLEPYIKKASTSISSRFGAFKSSTGNSGQRRLASPSHTLASLKQHKLGILAEDGHVVEFVGIALGYADDVRVTIPYGGSGTVIVGNGSLITMPGFMREEVTGEVILSPNYPEYNSYDEWFKDITTDGIYPNKR